MDIKEKQRAAAQDMHRRKAMGANSPPTDFSLIQPSKSYPTTYREKSAFDIYADSDRADEQLNRKFAEKGGGNKLAHDKFDKKGAGLGDELMKWMEKAAISKKESKGKKKPFGDVSQGSIRLQQKGAEKRELEKIRKRVQDNAMC